MSWEVFVVIILFQLISSALMPKQNQTQNVTPGDLSVPKVDASSPVPVLFGTRLISSPNCIWWGDVGVTPIKVESGGKK